MANFNQNTSIGKGNIFLPINCHSAPNLFLLLHLALQLCRTNKGHISPRAGRTSTSTSNQQQHWHRHHAKKQ